MQYSSGNVKILQHIVNFLFWSKEIENESKISIALHILDWLNRDNSLNKIQKDRMDQYDDQNVQ